MKYHIVLFLFLIILSSCSETKENKEQGPLSQAQKVIDESISFHGMEKMNNSGFSLDFRDMSYSYEMKDGMYEYIRNQTDSLGQNVVDVLTNNGLIRTTNGEVTEVEDEKRAAYARSVNSVIYFFRLPFGLNDQAVIKEYQGTTVINEKEYHEVRVTFKQSGGGEDFDDIFLYWFDVEDYSMDFLAYLYHTDEGGMRFREAINPHRVNGVLIQDYINYKPEDETMDINGIDELYKNGELEELSRIINNNVEINFF